VRHTSRSSDLLRVEESRARVFQSGGGVTTGGARDIITKVALRTS
jgi:hypothetical protein